MNNAKNLYTNRVASNGMNLQEILEEIKKIQKRNRRVSIDKAWEVSSTRRFFVASLIYIIATLWLVTIGDSLALLKAIVPSLGYIISTFSLPMVKKQWIQSKYRKIR